MPPPLRSCAFRYRLGEAGVTLTSMAELCHLVVGEVLLEEAFTEMVSFIYCYPVWERWVGGSGRKD